MRKKFVIDIDTDMSSKIAAIVLKRALYSADINVKEVKLLLVGTLEGIEHECIDIDAEEEPV